MNDSGRHSRGLNLGDVPHSRPPPLPVVVQPQQGRRCLLLQSWPAPSPWSPGWRYSPPCDRYVVKLNTLTYLQQSLLVVSFTWPPFSFLSLHSLIDRRREFVTSRGWATPGTILSVNHNAGVPPGLAVGLPLVGVITGSGRHIMLFADGFCWSTFSTWRKHSAE